MRFTRRDLRNRAAPLLSLSLSVALAALAACSSSSGDGPIPPGYVAADDSVFGVAINANSPAQTPSRDDLRQLGARWVRTIVYDGQHDRVDAALRSYRCLGVKNLLLINQESFGPTHTPPPNDDNAAWETYAAVFADQAEAFVQAHQSIIDAVEIWNEPDLPNDPEPHLAAERFALLVYKVYPRLKAILKDRPVIQGAVAGQYWPGYLYDVAHWLIPRGVIPDGVGFHPYGQRSGGYPSTFPPWNPGDPGGELSNVIQIAFDTANGELPADEIKRPIWITEFGLPASMAPDGAVAPYVRNAYGTDDSDPGGSHVFQMLHRKGVIARAFWFAWDDRVATPEELASNKRFGLVEPTDSVPRPLRDSGKEYLAAAGRLPACGTDSASGVDGTKSLADLAPDEKQKLCDWTATQQGGYGKTYSCAGAAFAITKSDVAQCSAAIPANCSATVAETELCVVTVSASAIGGDDGCLVTNAPECRALRRCSWK